jgi:hypothetical protein
MRIMSRYVLPLSVVAWMILLPGCPAFLEDDFDVDEEPPTAARQSGEGGNGTGPAGAVGSATGASAGASASGGGGGGTSEGGAATHAGSASGGAAQVGGWPSAGTGAASGEPDAGGGNAGTAGAATTGAASSTPATSLPSCGQGNADGVCTTGCENGITDGTESDEDCGGECAPCELDRACRENHDCASEKCDHHRCVEGKKGKGKAEGPD